MEICNLMEELVRQTVEEIAREDANSGQPRYCGTEDCVIDAICYALNRIQPRYVSSARGYAHIVEDIQSDQQIAIDLVRLAHEALKRISSVRRGYYDEDGDVEAFGPSFNFPAITGRVLDGTRFFPLGGIEVELLIDEVRARMFDQRWNNPYQLDDHAPGTYIFWPRPIESSSAGEQHEFSCELRVRGAGYDPLSHFFTLTLTSEATVTDQVTLDREHKLPDLYVFTP